MPRLSVTTPLREIVDALNAYRPEAIVGYPTIAGLLADEQLEGRLRIAPRVLAFGSEPLTDDIARRVYAAWGVRPANVYATTEAPIVAASSPQDACLDLSEDPVVVEVVRGSSALARGMGLERLVDPDAPLGATFEELFVAQMTGLARTDPHRAARVVKEKR